MTEIKNIHHNQVSSWGNRKYKNMFYGATNLIFERAKKLRNNLTNEEVLLWCMLKEKFPALKFRTQHPVSNYIADLYCHSQKLIIEIDGSIHDLAEN